MGMTPRQFIEAMSDCGVLAAEEAERLAAELLDPDAVPPVGDVPTTPATPGPDAHAAPDGANGKPSAATQELVRRLIADGKVTTFQARAILGGAGRGLRINEYIVLEKLGAGGMGAVYKARHRVMKRLVAIKVLPKAATQNPKLVQRFYREVEAAAKLTHHNIVTAYDAGEYQGAHYLVSEYVDGIDLSALLKRKGPVPLAKAVDYVVQAGKGLAYAHEHGVVHRDVKPGNILLSREGVVKVLDMGLARFTEADATIDEASLTMTGRLMGTVEYMAPEHAANPKNADHRSDIYSLGCTFYRLVTGKLPYKGETAVELIIAQREQPVPKLAETLPGVPPAVQQVFNRMLEKDPAARYQTMAEAIADLERAARHEQLPAAAAPTRSDFESDSSSIAGSPGSPTESLLGELAAASGAFDALGDIEPSDDASIAAPPTWHPPQSGSRSLALPIGLGAAAVVIVGLLLFLFTRSDPDAPTNPADPLAAAPGSSTNSPAAILPATSAGSTGSTTPTTPSPANPSTPTSPAADPPRPFAPGDWITLFDGAGLDLWEPLDHAPNVGDSFGDVTVEGRQIVLAAGDPVTGVAWLGQTPSVDYELTLEARLDNADQLNVVFPVMQQRATLQFDAVAQRVGLSRVNDTYLRDRLSPARFDGSLPLWHLVRIRVSERTIRISLNGQPVVEQPVADHRFHAPLGYEPDRPLMILADNGQASLRNLRVRRVEPEPAPTPVAPADPMPMPDPLTPSTADADPMPLDPDAVGAPNAPADPAPAEPNVLTHDHEDTWHDLLDRVDPQRDARGRAGIWSRQGATLVAASSQPRDLPQSTLLLPAQVSGSYQLRLTVTPRGGFGPVVLTLPVADGRLHLVIDGPTGTGFLTQRPRAAANDAPRDADDMVRQRTLTGPGSTTIQLMVRLNDEGQITAAARIGARSVPMWRGTVDDLDRPAARRPGAPEAPGIPGPAQAAAESRHAVALRLAARELVVNTCDLQLLPGGRAVLRPVDADDPADESIDLGQPANDPPTRGPDSPSPRPGDTRPQPPDRRPPLR